MQETAAAASTRRTTAVDDPSARCGLPVQTGGTATSAQYIVLSGREYPLPECRRSNHLALTQISDGRAVVTELGQNLLGMLSEPRRRAVDHRRRARQSHRLVHHRG